MQSGLRILIVGPNGVSDIVVSNCLLQALKQQYPNCHITVAVRAQFHPVLHRMAEVDACLTLPLQSGKLPPAQLWRFCRRLAKQQFDRAYVLSPSAKYAVVPWLAQITPRFGLAHGRWVYRQLLETPDASVLPVLLQQRLLQLVDYQAHAPVKGLLPLPRLIAHKAMGEHVLRGRHKEHQKVIALCPGAEYGPAKRWPAHHFASLAETLLAQGYAIVLLGSPKEQAAGEAIQAQCNNACINLVGQTTLTEVIDILAAATAAISNDSGLLHIAAAVATPVVGIFGSTSSRYTPPLSLNSTTISLDLACSPCAQRTCPLGHTRCLQEITPAQVHKKLMRVLQQEEQTHDQAAEALLSH